MWKWKSDLSLSAVKHSSNSYEKEKAMEGGGNKPSFSSISSLSSEALYPGFDAEIKSYYFILAGVEMQCMDRHTTYGKKTTKAQPVIRWINNTFVGTGTRMPRYTELFVLYEHK